MSAEAFWDARGEAPPPFTDAARAAVEAATGHSLPEAYAERLRGQNGGSTLGFVFDAGVDLPGWGDPGAPLDEMFGVGPASDAHPLTLLDAPYLAAEWGLPPGLVPFSGDGHHWLCFDHRAGEPPSVAWIDADDTVVVTLAPTVDAFFDGLRPNG